MVTAQALKISKEHMHTKAIAEEITKVARAHGLLLSTNRYSWKPVMGASLLEIVQESTKSMHERGLDAMKYLSRHCDKNCSAWIDGVAETTSLLKVRVARSSWCKRIPHWTGPIDEDGRGKGIMRAPSPVASNANTMWVSIEWCAYELHIFGNIETFHIIWIVYLVFTCEIDHLFHILY